MLKLKLDLQLAIEYQKARISRSRTQQSYLNRVVLQAQLTETKLKYIWRPRLRVKASIQITEQRTVLLDRKAERADLPPIMPVN